MSYSIPHLSLRMVKENTLEVPSRTVLTPEDAATVAHALIGDRPVEHMIALCIDANGNLTGVTTLSQGGQSQASIRPLDVIRAVLATHAAAFILAHNHPSGSPKPSAEDEATTEAISSLAAIIGVPMMDHVIVTRNPDAWSQV